VQLVIAGSAHSGNPVVFPPLEPEIRRLGLEDLVVLPGRVSEEDKIALYQAADLYVTPSLYEGFGLTALEAMASGVPVVAADVGAFSELIVEDETGVVTPVGDSAALADAAGRYLADPALLAAHGENGLARVNAMFPLRREAESIGGVYEAVWRKP
jgi:mannosyltransferase